MGDRDMVQALQKTITLDEFLQLPETKPASEYINGAIVQKPMPKGKHSTIQGELITTVNAVGKPQRIAWAFPELRCTFGGRSIVPDIAVFEWPRIPLNAKGKIENRFEIPPDWIIEILSPDQSSTRVINKILFCLKNKTKLGWLIDPEEELVFVYFADRTIAFFEEPGDRIPVPPFAESFNLTVGQMFSWLTQ